MRELLEDGSSENVLESVLQCCSFRKHVF